MDIESVDRDEQFLQLTARHHKLIRALCWRHASGEGERYTELMQECLVDIWYHLPSLRSGSAPLQEAAWVAWQCRSTLSHHSRRQLADLLPLDGKMADSLLDDTTMAEWREWMQQAGATLGRKQRHLLSLILEGYEVWEIATLMETTPEAVYKMRQRLIAKLRKQVKEIT